MFNQSAFQNKTPLTVAPVACRLEVVNSGRGVAVITNGRQTQATDTIGIDFTVNPETIEIDSTAETKELPVLGLGQPLTAYQFSQTVITVPTVKFWTPNNAYDLTEILATLESWTKPTTETLEPPKLKFMYGSLIYEPLLLTRFRRTIVQMREGKPTQANGDLQFKFAPAEPEPLNSVDGETLTERERQTYAGMIGELVRRGVIAVASDAVIAVNEKGLVEAVVGTVRTTLGNIWSLLGNAVRPGRTAPIAGDVVTNATANQRGV